MQLRYLGFHSSKTDASVTSTDPAIQYARLEEGAGPAPGAARTPASSRSSSPDAHKILNSIGEAVYDWDLASDLICWGPNAATVLGFGNLATLQTGRAFAECLSHDSENSRHEAIARATAVDAGMGVPFQIRYGLTPPDRPRDTTVWIEDTGRWFAGPDGAPARAHGLVRVITDRYKQERQLACRSRFDSLTGAMNRASLLERTSIFFALAAMRKQSFAALLVSLDNLFLLNRTYGYDIADEIVGKIASVLRENCRERDLVARYAGNKFALVLENCDQPELTAAAQRLLDATAATTLETSAGPIRVSLRIGGAVAPRHGRDAHMLFQNAEAALDVALSPGAPRLSVYDPSLARDNRRMVMRNVSDDIVSALQDRQIVIALQPLVHGASGVPAFYEALMRLRRPNGALALPAAILPMAEKSGLIRLVDRRVLDLALSKLRQDPKLRLAVNVSGLTLHDTEFFDRLNASLEPCPEIARRLTIELTETCVIEDVDVTARAMAAIRKLGAKIAMDDFGAGHTSFKNLRRFEFDQVKIDGAFIQNLARSADDRFFVRTLIDLARHIGIPVVAEWVEDEATARILRDWGVDYLQGDYFGAAKVAPSDLAACVA